MPGHDFYLAKAAIEAAKSPMGQRLGAVVVFRGMVVGRGYNVYGTMERLFSLHAEVRALASASWLPRSCREECDLYVVRIGTDRMERPFKMSHPCCNCQRAIADFGIRRVYYTTNADFNRIYLEMAIKEHRGGLARIPPPPPPPRATVRI